MAASKDSYPAKLEIDYPSSLDRVTTLLRVFWAIPIVIVLSALTSAASAGYFSDASQNAASNGGGIEAGLFLATALMIIFRQSYPRWWYDFALQLNRFSTRVGAYLFLLTDRYPSTVDNQSVHLSFDYPNVKRDLNRWLPLVKWLLVIPHYLVLVVLTMLAVVATVIAWFAILFTGKYPRDLFDFVVGVGRWYLRVNAYAFLLVTDQYPPFSLK